MLIGHKLGVYKLSTYVKRPGAKAALILLALLPLAGLSCGKRKAPQPPRERVMQRVEIEGFQRGNQVVLTWRMPARNAGEGNVLNISRADIYRLAEPRDAPLTLSKKNLPREAF